MPLWGRHAAEIVQQGALHFIRRFLEALPKDARRWGSYAFFMSSDTRNHGNELARPFRPEDLRSALQGAVVEPFGLPRIMDALASGCLADLLRLAIWSETLLEELRTGAYFHNNGFYRVPVPGGDALAPDDAGNPKHVRLRLSYWQGDLHAAIKDGRTSQIESPHDHAYASSSRLLAGSYLECFYTESPQPSSTASSEWYRSTTSPNDRGRYEFEYGEPCYLTPESYSLVGRGALIYRQPHAIHRVIPVPHVATVSLFGHVGYASPRTSRVYSKPPYIRETARPQLSADELRRVLTEILAAIESPESGGMGGLQAALALPGLERERHWIAERSRVRALRSA